MARFVAYLQPAKLLNQFHIINCSGWSENKFTNIQNGHIRASKGLPVTLIPWMTHENFCKELLSLCAPQTYLGRRPLTLFSPTCTRVQRQRLKAASTLILEIVQFYRNRQQFGFPHNQHHYRDHHWIFDISMVGWVLSKHPLSRPIASTIPFTMDMVMMTIIMMILMEYRYIRSQFIKALSKYRY